MRSGPEGLSWMTDKQISHDVGIGHRKVGPHLRELVDLGLTAMQELEGTRYICLVDPVHVIAGLIEKKALPQPIIDALEDDLVVMTTRKVAVKDVPVENPAAS